MWLVRLGCGWVCTSSLCSGVMSSCTISTTSELVADDMADRSWNYGMKDTRVGCNEWTESGGMKNKLMVRSV